MGIYFVHFLSASKSEAALDGGHAPNACKGRALLHVSVACISGPGGGPYGMLVLHPWRKDWPPLIHSSTEDSQADSGKLKGFCPFRMKSTFYLTINLPFETSGVLIL